VAIFRALVALSSEFNAENGPAVTEGRQHWGASRRACWRSAIAHVPLAKRRPSRHARTIGKRCGWTPNQSWAIGRTPERRHYRRRSSRPWPLSRV